MIYFCQPPGISGYFVFLTGMDLPPLRVCYFGTYRANYVRNQMMMDGLRLAGAEVLECHETLWHGIEDRVEATKGGWLKPAFWGRVLGCYFRLLRRYARTGAYDVMVVGYPGQFDLFLARLLSWLRGKPLVWDILMSIYLVAADRGLETKNRLTLKLFRAVEWLDCRLADRLILDTHAYVDWFCQTYHISAKKFRFSPIGADDRHFQPVAVAREENQPMRVIYYGTYIPNHGVPYMIETAALLERSGAGIEFEMIGTGPDEAVCRKRAADLGLRCVQFIPWLEKEELVPHIARADIILGSFGRVAQSYLTVHNKIYEGMAMGKLVITGESPAVLENFHHGEQLCLASRDDPQTLADLLVELRDDPARRAQIAGRGHSWVQEHSTLQKMGERFKMHLDEIVAEHQKKKGK